jgi:hypothetical protein
METKQVQSRIGPDGVLSLQLPFAPEDANRPVNVTVTPAVSAGEVGQAEWTEIVNRAYGSCAGLDLEEAADAP